MASPTLTRNRNVSQYLAEALDLEMARDERVLVLGEDVGAMGGVFGASRELQRRYGEWRVRDTPIAEAGFTGMALGLAMSGWRPVVELMFVDFIGVCLEQVYNAIAKNRYMSGGTVSVPLVLTTAGGRFGSAAQHSQCLWGLFAHLPGLKVAVPSSPYNHKGLLAAAIEEDDPVVFIEHKRLLTTKADRFRHGAEVPKERYLVPLGHADRVRAGDDVTVATLSLSVSHALEAAEALSAEGIELEVIDLQTLVPLDDAAVAASVERTGRLLVVDEDYRSFGLSAELVARVLERLGSKPFAVERLAVPDVPIPAARTLEEAVYPGPEAIAEAARRLVRA